MKHHWEYKRLGEVCTVIGGSTPKTDHPEYWGGEYNWFTPAELDGRKYYGESERKITLEAVRASGLTLMPKGTVLLSSRAPIGKVGITTSEAYCNQGFKNLVCGPSVLNEYLYHALIYFNDEIKAKGKGSTFKEISKSATESIKIPVPPMEEQERIVAELDEINELIAVRKEQIANLDALAQSLFYDTFGDPITNPKGWEVKKLGDICSLKAGKSIRANELTLNPQKDFFPCYGGNGIRGYLNRYSHEGLFIIIGRQGALCGNVRLANGKFYATEHAVVVSPKITLEQVWLYFALTYMNLNSYATGVAQPGLSVNNILPIPIPIPPLETQQQFAKQVEAIEKQKAVLNESLMELQNLLDSRMDYWFN